MNNLFFPALNFKFQYFSGLHCLPAFPSNSFQIVAVCDFYTYVRYIQQGLVKADGMWSLQSFWKFALKINLKYISSLEYF